LGESVERLVRTENKSLKKVECMGVSGLAALLWNIFGDFYLFIYLMLMFVYGHSLGTLMIVVYLQKNLFNYKL